MAGSELQDSCYKPAGVPVTPQARRLGYEFPVYVSSCVFNAACRWNGLSKFETNLDRRIFELLQYAYEGMLKKLTQQDDFLYYPFKCWYWDRHANAKTKKKKRDRFGVRLFVDDDGSPWMYIFDIKTDKIDGLEKGELNEEHSVVELQQTEGLRELPAEGVQEILGEAADGPHGHDSSRPGDSDPPGS